MAAVAMAWINDELPLHGVMLPYDARRAEPLHRASLAIHRPRPSNDEPDADSEERELDHDCPWQRMPEDEPVLVAPRIERQVGLVHEPCGREMTGPTVFMDRNGGRRAASCLRKEKNMAIQQDTILDVQGMTCGSCVRHVTIALEDVDGVDKVDVKLRDGTVAIKHDLVEAPVDALIDALREAGYESQLRKP
jgi:copper chaperone